MYFDRLIVYTGYVLALKVKCLTVVCDDRNYLRIKASRRCAKHQGRHSLFSGKHLYIIVITIVVVIVVIISGICDADSKLF